MDREKSVDSSWKQRAASEKEQLKGQEPPAGGTPQGGPAPTTASPEAAPSQETQAAPDIEVNFINYMTSLTFQALIFLGEIPNPLNDNKVETNLKQAKFLIDTLVLLRDKTKGNLTKDEEEFLGSSIYELQIKFVELQQKNPAGQAT